MTDEHITSEALPDTGGQEAGSEEMSVAAVLSKELGKEFADDQSALKAVKDTFNYVGEVGKYKKSVESVMSAKNMSQDEAVKFIEAMAQSPASSDNTAEATAKDGYVSREEFERATFYAENPQYKEHKTLLETLSKGTGKSLGEVIKMDEFKSVFDAAKAHAESGKSKSVVHSNPRINAATDSMSEARAALDKGDYHGARKGAVGAVMEAVGLVKE